MISRLLVALIRVYQRVISPWLGKVCRFEPSCSRYAVACLEEHGAWRGSLLSFWRVCKCHPFHPGGFDPPPRALPRDTPSPNGQRGSHEDGSSLAPPERSRQPVEQG